MTMMRFCLGCSRHVPVTEYKDGRCRECDRAYYRKRRKQRGSTTQRGLGHQHQQLAKQVLSEEKVCWCCGQPARPSDPLEVDHVIPRSEGGKTVRENLRAAHRSCNRSRGGGVGRRPSDGRLTPVLMRREFNSGKVDAEILIG
jgi:5-methylcytosine-specific restriction endonuclease McrA